MRSRCAAMTLIEVVVAMACFLLLTTAALSVFLPSLGRFATADTAYDAQRATVAAVAMLSADLRESSASLVFTQAGPAGNANVMYVAIPTPRDAGAVFHVLALGSSPPMPGDSPFGTPDWQGWIEYWPVPDPNTPNTSRLLRRVRSQHPLVKPSGAYDFSALGPNAKGPMVASAVSLLQLQSVPSLTGHGRIRLRVTTSRLLHDVPTSFEGDRTVEMLY